MHRDWLVFQLKNLLAKAEDGDMVGAEMGLTRLAKEQHDADLAAVRRRNVTRLKDGAFITMPEGGPATEAEKNAWLRNQVFEGKP
jgi:hypothetical protein